MGLVPDQGAKTPHGSPPKSRNIKNKQTKKPQYFNKFNKEFKNDPQEKNKKIQWGSTLNIF